MTTVSHIVVTQGATWTQQPRGTRGPLSADAAAVRLCPPLTLSDFLQEDVFAVTHVAAGDFLGFIGGLGVS